MQRKRLLIVLLPFLCLMIVPFAAQAATITVCAFDKDTYHQGETGYITVAIYNDREDIIRVTELFAIINYYYADGNVYLQSFFTNATLPAEIQQGQSGTFRIPFSLPTNIASGYTSVYVKAITQLWMESERWVSSDHPSYQPTLYIESPYIEQLEEQVTANEQLQEQLQEQVTSNEQLQEQLQEQVTSNEQLQEQLREQLTINKNTTNMVYLFGVTTIVFAAVTAFLFILYRRTRVFTQPIV